MIQKLKTAAIVFIVILLAIPALADTESPVLDGGSYTSYDTFFVHGTNAESEWNPDVLDAYNWGGGHVTRISGFGDAWIDCPIPGYYDKTGGVKPRVRYLGLYFGSDSSGIGYPEVDRVDIYNGNVKIVTIPFTPQLYTNGEFQIKVIDLYDWYVFDRGLNMDVHIQNDATSQASAFTIAGYGARFEW